MMKKGDIMNIPDDLFCNEMDEAIEKAHKYKYQVRGNGTGTLLGIIATYLKWICILLEDISQSLKNRK